MERLPEEVLVSIVNFLHPKDVVALQTVSRYHHRLTRDSNLWRAICFHDTRLEKRHRRLKRGMGPDAQIIALRQKLAAQLRPQPVGEAVDVVQPPKPAADRRARALANWEPAYRDEQIDYYQEYIHRHAPISVDWFPPAYSRDNSRVHCVATGVGMLYSTQGRSEKMVAPLEDGSVCVWNASCSSARPDSTGFKSIAARSEPGLLTPTSSAHPTWSELERNKAIMTENGALDCVSVDSYRNVAYFAVQNHVNEVDLNSLNLIARHTYPMAVSALSEARHPVPVTVGTHLTLHLLDPREESRMHGHDSLRCELIGGSAAFDSGAHTGRLQRKSSPTRAVLLQANPLSILHLNADVSSNSGEIWVAGQFTSLLSYDRRYFPRLRGSIHSGARLSSLTVMPYPYIPRNHSVPDIDALPFDIETAKGFKGHTIIAGGEYKLKGSLELYGMSREPAYVEEGAKPIDPEIGVVSIKNRQTAAGSKLLSVAVHGGRIVYADSNGYVRWMERDGFTQVRRFNLNASDGIVTESAQQDTGSEEPKNDMVQKIVSSYASDAQKNTSGKYEAVDGNGLFLWTADGNLGHLHYGPTPRHAVQDADHQKSGLGNAESITEKERQYARAIRKALERQADEALFLSRGLASDG